MILFLWAGDAEYWHFHCARAFIWRNHAARRLINAAESRKLSILRSGWLLEAPMIFHARAYDAVWAAARRRDWPLATYRALLHFR